MATTADIISGLPIQARGMATQDLLRYLDEVRNDIRDILYTEFAETFLGIQEFPIFIPPAPSAEISSVAGNIDNGVYKYRVSFITALGETLGGAESEPVYVNDKTVAGQISLTSIPLGDENVTQRKIYRQQNLSGDYKLLATIADNTTETYTDNTAQSGLGAKMKNGFVLASDFYEHRSIKNGDYEIPVLMRNPASDYPDKAYCWIDYEDNPDGTSSAVLSLSQNFPLSGTITMMYWKDIDDATDGGTLPYPISLHNKLLPVLRLGVSYIYLSELSGEDDQVIKIQARYDNALRNLSLGRISTFK